MVALISSSGAGRYGVRWLDMEFLDKHAEMKGDLVLLDSLLRDFSEA